VVAVRLHVLAATALVVMATMGGAKKAVGMFKGADVNGNSHSWRRARCFFVKMRPESGGCSCLTRHEL
jgi:hypothetical protein